MSSSIDEALLKMVVLALSVMEAQLVVYAHRYLVEHMRVGDGSSLTVHCRDIHTLDKDAPFPRTGGRRFVIEDLSGQLENAGGMMVITRYTMEQSLRTWAGEVMPHLAKFCRVLARLFCERSYQELFITSENQADWYQDYADVA